MASVRPPDASLNGDSPRKRQKLSPAATPPTDTPTTARSLNPASVVTMVRDDSQLQKETEVGITQFTGNSGQAFSGILKKRYTDFLVNEILPSGKVVHLTSYKVPTAAKAKDQTSQLPQPKPQATTEAEDDEPKRTPIPGPEATLNQSVQKDNQVAETPVRESKISETRGIFELSNEDQELLASYFGADKVEPILSLYQRTLQTRKVSGSVESPAVTDRGLRTSMHKAIRRIFSSRLETITNDDGSISVMAASGAGRWSNTQKANTNQGPRTDRFGWKDLGGEYLHFSLFKENKDTMEVISFLSKQLKGYPKNFQFAGTKDRRAVTVQRVSVYRMQAEKVAGLNKILRGSKVGDFEYQPYGLALGELTGNEFVITLRDTRFPFSTGMTVSDKIKFAQDTVGQSLSDLSRKGFINYYGLQRFGTFSTSTDAVGLKILQDDFKGACDAILSYNPDALLADDEAVPSDKIASDDKNRAMAIHEFQTKGATWAALEKLPKKFSAEFNIIKHLGGKGRDKDFLGALMIIPRNLRLMYVHAYQSLVWNMVASERWERFGDKVVEGDLVLVNEHKEKMGGEPALEEVDEAGEPVILPEGDERAIDRDEMFERARALSKAEADGGEYSIFDIVLPTPGFDILYPANSLADFYKSFMASERGGGLDPHNMRRKWKDASLSGSYRKFMGRPMNCSSEVKAYLSDDQQLVLTDLDKLQGKKLQDLPNPEELDEQAEFAKIAVIVKFQLQASQYATMALRELMKGGVTTYKPDFGGGR